LLGALGCSLLFGSIDLARCPQLVAFVPERNQSVYPDGAKLAVKASSQSASARIVNASYASSRNAAKNRTSSGVRAAKIDALVSEERRSQSQDGQPSMQLTAAKQEFAPSSKTPSYTQTTHQPRPVMLKAEMPSLQTAPVEQQQWVVVTTWEQIRSSNPKVGLKADYEAGTNATATSGSIAANSAIGDGSVQSKTQLANQITITRLILKIYPVSSFSAQPALAPVREGWFVIQL
jgi:hypothetical protein